MSHLHKLKTLLRMSGRDRLQIALTFLLLAAIRLGLWLLPFQTLLQNLEKLGRVTPASSLSVRQIVWMVNVSSRYMPGVKCLARALTARVLLNWYGYASELRIGVAKGEQGELEAHAWVEYQGKVIIGGLSTLSRYVPLPSLNLTEK
jgi:Transglutaminase-like superfamily